MLSSISERQFKRFDRACDKIYGAVVKEDVPYGYRSLVFVMRLIGIWSTANDSYGYRFQALTLFMFVGILMPFSVFVMAFYFNSIQEAMELTASSLSYWTIALRTAITYWRSDSLRDVFRIHTKLTSSKGSSTEKNERVARVNFLVHTSFSFFYAFTISVALVQVALSKPEDALFPSTSPLPYAFAQRRSVYLSVLVYQMAFSYMFTVCAAIMDSLLFALINTVCGHMEQLKDRLKALGSRGDDDDTFYRDMIECCQCYENCIR